MSNSLFQRLLSEQFHQLPGPITALHDGRSKVLRGECDVERGSGFVATFLAWVTSLPPAGLQQPIEVAITCNERGEIWVRKFGARSMRSSLVSQGSTLVEWLGPVRFKFKLVYDAANAHINWQLHHVAVLGVPLPVGWFDRVSARESMRGGKYCFDVSATLPFAGLLVRYHGWLDVH